MKINIIPYLILLLFAAGFIAEPLKYKGSYKTISDSVITSDTSIISEGKTLYESKCRKCHALYEPGDYKLSRWKKNLKEMKFKAELNNEE